MAGILQAVGRQTTTMLRQLRWAARRYAFEVAVAVMAVPVGVTAILLGSQVSTAMSRVLGGRYEVVRLWGALMFAGGLLVVAGICMARPALERAGLRVLGPAFALYSLSVVLGLGTGGLVAGPIFAAMAVACFVRSRASIHEEAERLAAKSILDSRPDRAE